MREGSLSIRLRLFERTLGRFQETLALADEPVARDACIKRFEFTFETAWKAIQADALIEGMECNSPRDCFRTAFRLGILSRQESAWMRMVEDRNRTSHTYDEEISDAVYKALGGYAALFSDLFAALMKREESRQKERAEEGGTP